MCVFGSLSPHSKKAGGSKAMRWMHCAPFLHSDLIRDYLKKTPMRSYFAIGRWNTLHKTVICLLVFCLQPQPSDPFDQSSHFLWEQFTSKRLEEGILGRLVLIINQMMKLHGVSSIASMWEVLEIKVEIISEELQTKHDQGPGLTEHTDAKLGSAVLGWHKVLPRVQKSHIQAWLINLVANFIFPASAISRYSSILIISTSPLSDWLNRAKLHLGLFSVSRFRSSY